MIRKFPFVAALIAATLVAPAMAQSGRDYVSVVGSSTVYPFTTTVAEQFGRAGKFKTPKVESTGTGGGFKLFCGGVGVQHPDVTNASRPIKTSEQESCAKAGVKDIIEIKVGYGGIVVANSRKGKLYQLTRKEIYQALAKQVPDPANAARFIDNPYKTWNQINKSLPADRIEVLGPPPTSGTRDSFVEMVMEPGCLEFAAARALKDADETDFKRKCHGVREDGGYIEAGENDNLIVQKLDANPKALGIFDYSFLEENVSHIQGSLIDGVKPDFDNIASSKYPVSRPLYVYVKRAHLGVIPGLNEFVTEYVGSRSMGMDGYLADRGLVPLPSREFAEVRAATLQKLK